MDTANGMHFDWESEKRRLLVALESDFSPADPVAPAQRLKIEDVLRSTEIAIREKDREIEYWKKRCDELDSQAARELPSTAATQLLDADEIVQQERARLQQLEDQLREKLRLAEVELSMERATLARKQAELEEQLQSASNRVASNQPVVGERNPPRCRGRWLARLGLTEADRERGKPELGGR
jgi:hypothetical protein